MPAAYAEFDEVARKLENHYREMQDVEFTIEKNKLWMLQTRDGKRTAQAAVRIAVDMAEEGLISREDAVLRVAPEQVDFFLHPQFDRKAVASAKAAGTFLGRGLNVSPGAACGVVALDADLAEKWSKDGKDVIMVRPETKPGRCSRHAGGQGDPDEPRRPHQPCGPGGPAVRKARRGGRFGTYDRHEPP